MKRAKNLKTEGKGRKKGMVNEGIEKVGVEELVPVLVADVATEPPEPLHKRIVVLGAGGVGFWLGVSLSRAGVEYEIWDDDNFMGGLGHTRLPVVEDQKTKKVNFLRGFVMMAMGDDPPRAVPMKFSPDKWNPEDLEGRGMLEGLAGALIVDASDMGLPVRKKIWASAREARARCLRVSYDGAQGGIVTVSEGLPFANKRTGGGYADTPDLALSLAAGGIGAKAVRQALVSSDRIEFQINLGELMAGIKVEEEEVTGDVQTTES